MRNGWLACGVVALMALVGGSGCASIIKGTRQRVSISAIPAGSRVTVYDEYNSIVISQQAPCTVSLKRGGGYFSSADYRVQVEMDGYTPAVMNVSGSINGWYIIGNFFIGGFIGWLIVDPLTGGMWDLQPKAINASLAKQQSALPSRDAALFVHLTRQPPRNPVP